MGPTLLVLAAGMGSRYGGLKQLDRFGPSGETIMDYSVSDAVAAGFERVVFVIRRDFESAFRAALGGKYQRRIAVDYVFQQLDDIPPGFTVPPGRTKPWGTAHAIWCARRAIGEPFVSINADDYYGKQAFKAAAAHVMRAEAMPGTGTGAAAAGAAIPEYCMVGYPILQTLSEHAAVARAVCDVDELGYLRGLVERMKLERSGERAQYVDEAGGAHPLEGGEVVSMNFWGFAPSLFRHLERHLVEFLEAQARAAQTAECLIPVVVGDIIKEKAARVRVLPTADAWFGVTHPQDKPDVMAALRARVARGEYPSPLWADAP